MKQLPKLDALPEDEMRDWQPYRWSFKNLETEDDRNGKGKCNEEDSGIHVIRLM